MAEKTIPVRLPEGLVKELDKMVKEGLFLSRLEVLRYGARITVLLAKRTLSLHEMAEELGYLSEKET